jgi:hypothetical protein
MSQGQEKAEKLERARNLRPPRERKRAFPVNRPAARRLSAVPEKAERDEDPRKLQLAPRREQA